MKRGPAGPRSGLQRSVDLLDAGDRPAAVAVDRLGEVPDLVELDRRGVYPPVKVLPSLSRLMDSGIGEGYTDADHPALAHQLFAAYARAVRVRTLASVMGEQGLPEADRKFLEFGQRFEEQFVSQSASRTLEESMAVGWNVLRGLPRNELARLSDAQIKRHLEEPARA